MGAKRQAREGRASGSERVHYRNFRNTRCPRSTLDIGHWTLDCPSPRPSHNFSKEALSTFIHRYSVIFPPPPRRADLSRRNRTKTEAQRRRDRIPARPPRLWTEDSRLYLTLPAPCQRTLMLPALRPSASGHGTPMDLIH